MAGVLDSSRFRAFVAEAIGVSVRDVTAMVMGGHGDTMVPLTRFCTVNGVPIANFLPEDKISAIVERTKKAGGEVVGLLKTGSAFVSPAFAALEMAESFLQDAKRMLVSAVYCHGEYGVEGYYIGAPAIIGAGGIEKVVELPLNSAELDQFNSSVGHVKAMVDGVKW